MLIVTAYHPGDADQALGFATWLKDLGGAKGHELILVRDTRCDLEQSERIRSLFAESFDNVESLDFVDHFQKWPDSPNAIFGMVARHIRQNPRPWLFCEPDCVLLKAGAFDLIAAEYQEALSAGKVFLGDFVSVHTPELDVPDHCSGNAVYPGDMMKYAGVALIAGDIAWDVAAAAQILPQMHKSRLIHHSWKHGAFADWDQFEREVLAFKPDVAIFHADKTMSLYPILRERMNLPSKTIPLSAVGGFPVEPELTSIGGLLRGERHSISGVTVGETTPICDIFIKTYPPDYPWLKYCLRSISPVTGLLSGFRRVVLITPEDKDRQWWDGNHFVDLTVTELPEYGPDGYLSQQVFKLYADTLTDASHILFLDSDTIFTRHVTPETYFTDGRIDWLITPYEKTETPWKPITEKFLGRPVEFEAMRRMPFVVPRWLLESMRQFCVGQHGMTLDKYVMSQPYRAFSEFNALGAFAYHFHRDRFNFINTEEVPPEQWPPLTVLQKFSHGGLTPEIEAEFEEILKGGDAACQSAPVTECLEEQPVQDIPTSRSSTVSSAAPTSEPERAATAPWENKAESLAEVRSLAETLKKFCGRPPEVRAVRQALHDAGVIQLAYRFKKRKGWKRKVKK